MTEEICNITYISIVELPMKVLYCDGGDDDKDEIYHFIQLITEKDNYYVIFNSTLECQKEWKC